MRGRVPRMCCCGCAMPEFEQTAQAVSRWLAPFGIDPTRDWMSIMKARDVMTRKVISMAPDASVLEALRLMLQHEISGLPIVDRSGSIVGIVTEGDFLRRAETGTERKRPRWLEFLVGSGPLARDYVPSHARRVEEALTPVVETAPGKAHSVSTATCLEHNQTNRFRCVP